MKVLLDENIAHQLRGYLLKHETSTVAYLGWSGLTNGQLLNAAERAGFDVLISGDLSLEYQQNLPARKIAIVSLSSHNWRIIKNHLPKIAAAVDRAKAGALTRVECGVFARRRKPEGPTLR